MSRIDDIEQDIATFLNNVDELKREDRKELLLSMFKKHIVLSEGELNLSKHDFDVILSNARVRYAKEALPVNIGGKALLPNEAVNFMLVNATIEVLNSKGAIKRLPRFTRR